MQIPTILAREESTRAYARIADWSFAAHPSIGLPNEAPVETSVPFTAVYERDGDWWIGYVEELPGANAQERTLDKARQSLREAVRDILEANRELTRTESEGHDVVRERPAFHAPRGSRTTSTRRDDVKRWALLNRLKDFGCEFLREGTRQTIYVNRASARSTAVPRHSEITNNMARKICKDLGIPPS